MVFYNVYRKYENKIMAGILLVVLFIFCTVKYDLYFDLNDDVLIKDILSGAYTGVPESLNIQMLYPMSLFISLLYRLFPKAPVYAFFLAACQFGCLWLIVQRSLSFFKKSMAKIAITVVWGTGITALFLWHLVFVQYTVTSGLLASAAAFLFITSDWTLAPKEYIKKNCISIILIFLAFCLRSEMLLLLFPLICTAGFVIWMKEEKKFKKDVLFKYFGIFGAVCIGMLLSYIVNIAAFSGREWKTYVDFFNSRTELYDYQGVPPYEENEELYERLGFTKSEQHMLFDLYNFGMDEGVDDKVLDAMSSYQAEKRAKHYSFADSFKEAFLQYRYRTFHKAPDDYPWNFFVIAAYFLVFALILWKAYVSGDKLWKGVVSGGWRMVLLIAVRSALWMFILMRGRAPIRITHSLYLMELCILLALLLSECIGIAGRIRKRKALGLIPALFCLLSLAAAGSSVSSADREFFSREEVNKTYRGMQDYCRSYKENFYFIDIYSSTSGTVPGTNQIYPYSEKMFENVDNSLSNYDIMGGWLCKSPQYKEKLDAFGIASMQEAIAANSGVFVLAELDRGTEWITDYFNDQEQNVEMESVDVINEILGVYRIKHAE